MNRLRCERCGLAHRPGQLFVEVESRVIIDTCELESTRAAAHAEPLPAGRLAYHATHPASVGAVLTRGLDPTLCRRDCNHICLAETPGIAAGVLLPKDDDGLPYVVDDRKPVVLMIDVAGLDLFFEFGEARHHDTVIEPSRILVIDPQPTPELSGWSDPGWRHDHSDCLIRNGLPLSRQLLNTATEEFDNRQVNGRTNVTFREIVEELARVAP